jgi:hypothetical protein
MSIIKKSDILTIILEQMSDIDEMARFNKEDVWRTVKLDEPITLHYDTLPTKKGGDIKIDSVGQDGCEGGPGIIQSKIVRVGPRGHALLQFNNTEPGSKTPIATRWVEITEIYSDLTTKKPNAKFVGLQPNKPQSSVYGTEKGTPEYYVSDVNVDNPGYLHSNPDKIPEDEKYKIQQRQDYIRVQGYAKREVVFPIVNDFFFSQTLSQKLEVCGIPAVEAIRDTTERPTNRELRMDFVGPNMSFGFNSIAGKDDVETMISEVIAAREKVFGMNGGGNVGGDADLEAALGDWTPDFVDTPAPRNDAERRQRKELLRQTLTTQVRLYAGYIYNGGRWTLDQSNDTNVNYTQKYKLFVKSHQDRGYSVMTQLFVEGTPGHNGYNGRFKMEFSKTLQDPNGNGVNWGQLIPTIEYQLSIPYPKELGGDGERSDTENLRANHRKYQPFYEEFLRRGLHGLGEKVMGIDPESVLQSLTTEKEGMNRLAESTPKMKVIVTEEQFKRIFGTV